MCWKIPVKIRTYYKNRTPYKVVTITLPKEIRKIIEERNLKYIYICLEPSGEDDTIAKAFAILVKAFLSLPEDMLSRIKILDKETFKLGVQKIRERGYL